MMENHMEEETMMDREEEGNSAFSSRIATARWTATTAMTMATTLMATAQWMTMTTTMMAAIVMDDNVDNNDGKNDDNCDGQQR